MSAPTLKSKQCLFASPSRALTKLAEVRNLVAFIMNFIAMPEHENSTVSPAQHHNLSYMTNDVQTHILTSKRA